MGAHKQTQEHKCLPNEHLLIKYPRISNDVGDVPNLVQSLSLGRL